MSGISCMKLITFESLTREVLAVIFLKSKRLWIRSMVEPKSLDSLAMILKNLFLKNLENLKKPLKYSTNIMMRNARILNMEILVISWIKQKNILQNIQCLSVNMTLCRIGIKTTTGQVITLRILC